MTAAQVGRRGLSRSAVLVRRGEASPGCRVLMRAGERAARFAGMHRAFLFAPLHCGSGDAAVGVPSCARGQATAFQRRRAVPHDTCAAPAAQVSAGGLGNTADFASRDEKDPLATLPPLSEVAKKERHAKVSGRRGMHAPASIPKKGVLVINRLTPGAVRCCNKRTALVATGLASANCDVQRCSHDPFLSSWVAPLKKLPGGPSHRMTNSNLGRWGFERRERVWRSRVSKTSILL